MDRRLAKLSTEVAKVLVMWIVLCLTNARGKRLLIPALPICRVCTWTDWGGEGDEWGGGGASWLGLFFFGWRVG